MESTVWAYNLFETCLWSAIGLGLLICACRPREKHRLFCLYGALSFAVFAASEVIEMHTGAWWKPLWLLALKASCTFFVAGLVFWWIRIQGGRDHAFNVLRGRERLR